MSTSENTEVPELKKLIDIAMNASLNVIHFGGSTSMADNALKNILSTGNVQGLNVMWRLDNILVSYDEEGQTKTFLKSVGSVGTNLTAVSKVMELTEKVRDGKVAVSDINSELKKIIDAPHIHSVFTFILIAGFAAAFYSKFHNGSLASVIIVFASAFIGQFIRLHLQKKEFRDSHITFICGLISASICSILLHLGFGEVGIPTLIASVIYLVPGLLMINGFVDVTRQRYIFIGAQRILNATFLFLILAVVILTAFTFAKF